MNEKTYYNFNYNTQFIVSSSVYGNISSKIIVKVENEIITNYDLKNKILTTLVLSGQEINQKNVIA